MGRSSGTGSPISFRCWKERRDRTRVELGMQSRQRHEVRLTGRERPYRASGHALVGRSTRVSREYVCSCGYCGWSNHGDLERSIYRKDVLPVSGQDPRSTVSHEKG